MTREHRAKALVVGTGAGGAVAATMLAEAGVDTLIIEEGKYYKPGDHGSVFDGWVRLYQSGGSTITIGKPPISVTLGRAVGGTTAVNSSTCFRPPPEKVASWKGPDYSEFEPFVEEVERRINAVVLDEELLGGNYRVLKRGCDALDVDIRPLKHNVKNCKMRGRCQFGCPEGAKQSTDISFIPRALECGATLLTEHYVDRVLMGNSRIQGVAGKCLADGSRFEARADIVVLAMGALTGPAFLLKNKLANSSRRVGCGLQIHPACRAAAQFDEIVDGHVALPQGAYIDKWKDRGVMLEGIFIHPGLFFPLLPGVGPEFKELVGNYRRMSAFGAFVDDTSVGRVLPGRFGMRFNAFYQMNQADAEGLRFGLARIAEIYLAAGARRVFSACSLLPVIENHDDLRKFESLPVRPKHLELGAFHPLGTCPMGADPRQSVVDFDLRSHDVENLYLMDGSVIPGSLGVNPQVTIMTVVMRAAQRLAEKLAR